MRRWLGLLALTVVMVAACGESTPAGSSVDTVAPSTAGPSTTAPPAVGVVAVEVPPCDLLTADEVASATGLEVEGVSEDGVISCVFDLGPEAGVDVFVGADDGQGRLGGPAALFEGYTAMIADGEAEAIAGLGERAVYTPVFRGLAIDAGGGRYISLGISGGYQQLQEPRDVLITLAMAALERL
jgi:hypothetical protein